jgi:phage-related protein
VAQSTISQRIALEGAEDILKQLAELGQAGEKAIQQIQEATGGASPALTGLSAVAETVRGAFTRIGTDLAPVRARFAELGEAAHEVGTRLTEVASIFGVGLAAGIAGGLAGIFELIKSSAEYGHQLEVQSQVLGISVEQLQVFGKAAAAAGVDSDKLNTALNRFAQNVGKENEKLFQSAATLAELLPASLSQSGVAIVEGIKPVGTAIKSHIIGNIQDALPQINSLVEVLRTAFSEHGITVPTTFFDSVRQNLLNTGNDATAAAAKIREIAAQLGVNLPTTNILEQIRQGADRAKAPLLALGITFTDLQHQDITTVLLKAVDGLQKIENPTERARLALALFSRTWPEVLKALKGGSAGFDELTEAARKTGLLLDEAGARELSEANVALIKLGGAATGLRNQLALIFAPTITAAAEAFKKLIIDNAATLKAWAETIAEFVAPSVKNLAAQFGVTGDAAKLPGLTGDSLRADLAHGPMGPSTAPEGTETTSKSLDDIRSKFEGIKQSFLTVKDVIVTAFTAIKAVLDTVATVINAIFGTNFNAAGVAAVLVVAQLTGAFALLLPLLGLAAALIAALGTPIGIAVALIAAVVVAIVNWRTVLDALRGAVAAVAQGIAADFNTALGFISQLLGTIGSGIQALAGGVVPLVSTIFGAVSGVIQGALAAIAQAIAPVTGLLADGFRAAIGLVEDAFSGLVDWVAGAAQSILGILQPVLNFIASLASKLGGLLGAAGGGAGGSGDAGGLGVDSGASAPGFAPGGQVRGPSGIDVIPARLTAGEFVVRMQAVQHYGADLFHALNQMALPMDLLRGYSLGGIVSAVAERFSPPMMGRSPLMLAAGGAVLGGGGVSNSLTLSLDGQSFTMGVSPGEVFDKLSRHARASAIRSAGRRPSWQT